MLFLNSQSDQNVTSSAQKLFGHKLRTTLPSLIPFTQTMTTENHTVTHSLKCNLPEIAPGTAVQIRTNEQNLWDKKGIAVGQNNWPPSHNILNERGNILARNCRHLIPTTEKLNINNDYDKVIPVSNRSTHANLMIDNQYEKPTFKDVYRTKSGLIVEKPKQKIDEMWYYFFLPSGRTINKPKHNEMWDDLFDKVTYWRNVIYMILLTFVF